MKLPRGVTESKGLIVITGLVTAIATDHCVRILNSGVDAFSAVQSKGTGNYVVGLTGMQVNDVYRYVVWLQKVPRLLIELILVMKLLRGVTESKGLMVQRLDVAAPASGRRWEPPRGGAEKQLLDGVCHLVSVDLAPSLDVRHVLDYVGLVDRDSGLHGHGLDDMREQHESPGRGQCEPARHRHARPVGGGRWYGQGVQR